jgi:hypothetical protein
MHERNLYQELALNKYLWGDIFLVRIDGLDIHTKESRLALLNQHCERKGLHSLADHWHEIDGNTGKALLRKMLQYDLAYSSAQITSADKAEYFYQALISPFLGKAMYGYTNWKGSPWDSSTEASWMPLTEHTFDLGIVLISQEAMLFAYSISED